MKYDDIINLDRPMSNYPKMDIKKRAAQFSPFAALTGYDDMILDASKIVVNKIESYDELESMISDKLKYLNNHIKDRINVSITYYDYINSIYTTIKGVIKRIDSINHNIKLENNKIIDMFDIIDIDI